MQDVGSIGDTVFITTPGGRQILIDGGPSPSSLLWEMGRQMPFWDRSLDLVVNTHSEADHLAGLPEVLERYQVSQVVLSDMENDTPLRTAWQGAMAAEGVSVTQAQAGMRLSLEDGVQIESRPATASTTIRWCCG